MYTAEYTDSTTQETLRSLEKQLSMRHTLYYEHV